MPPFCHNCIFCFRVENITFCKQKLLLFIFLRSYLCGTVWVGVERWAAFSISSNLSTSKDLKTTTWNSPIRFIIIAAGSLGIGIVFILNYCCVLTYRVASSGRRQVEWRVIRWGRLRRMQAPLFLFHNHIWGVNHQAVTSIHFAQWLFFSHHFKFSWVIYLKSLFFWFCFCLLFCSCDWITCLRLSFWTFMTSTSAKVEIFKYESKSFWS